MTRDDGATVVVVDNDVIITKVLRTWLEAAGYKCIVECTAAKAWQELQSADNHVAVVIADDGMTGTEIDGVEFLDRAAMREGKEAVSVIVMGAGIISESVERGSFAFVAKPLVKASLLAKLGMLIQHHQTELIKDSDRKERQAMKKEIKELTERALRTPVQIVVESIAALLNVPDLTPEVYAKLESLRSLIVQNSNLYRPAMPDYDAVTRSFLLSELSLYVPGSGLAEAFPSIDTNDPVIFELTQWSFDVFKYSEDDLLGLIKQMFVHLGLIDHFKILPDVLERFLAAVKRLYKQNPYHNWVHACDVTQATFCFLIHFEGLKMLRHLDCLALLVASLCHDVGHPGVNNAHLVMTQAELAVLYNDRSVLENFHAASVFRLLHECEDLNILGTLTKQQYKEVRRSVTDCILATDMAHHYEYVTKLGGKADSSSPEWDCGVADQRVLLLQCILKMADISNVARPWNISVEWADRVSEEFFAQGDLERSMGQDVAAFLDRNATNTVTNSINFIDFVALPFFKNLGRMHAKFGEDVVSVLERNRQRWDLQRRSIEDKCGTILTKPSTSAALAGVLQRHA